MKILSTLVCSFLFLLSNGQAQKLYLETELGVAYAFKLNNNTRMRTNHGIAFTREIYKAYKYPSLRSRLAVVKPVTHNFEINLSLGITFRFMEPKEQSHYTFFSFPLSVGTNMVFIKLKSHSSLSFFTNFGYHFKHPKYRYYDGAGGFIASAGIGSKNSSKTISYKIGYEVEQDRSFRRTTLPGSPTFDYIYWQYINQVYVSIGFKL